MIKSAKQKSRLSHYYIEGKHLLFKSGKKVPFTALCGWPWPMSPSTVLVGSTCQPSSLPHVTLTRPEKDQQSRANSTHSFPGCNQRTNSRGPRFLPSSVEDEAGRGIMLEKKTFSINLQLEIWFSTSPSTEVKEAESSTSTVSQQQTSKLIVLFEILKSRERKESL